MQAPADGVPSAPAIQEQQQFQPQPQPQFQPPSQPQFQTPSQPQFQTSPPPTVDEKKTGPSGVNQYYPPPNNPGASFRQPLPGNPVPARPVSPNPTPAVRPDRIASAPTAQVEGQVVRMDRTPRGGARVTFISAQRRQLPMQAVTANAAGQFQVNLASGGWLVYVAGPDGRQTFHSRIEVNGAQPAPLTVVTR